MNVIWDVIQGMLSSRSTTIQDVENISDTESEDSDIEYIVPPPPPLIDVNTTVFTPDVRKRILQMSRGTIDLTESERPENDIAFSRNIRNLPSDVRQKIHQLNREFIDLTEFETTEDEIQRDTFPRQLILMQRQEFHRVFAVFSSSQPDITELSDANISDADNDDSVTICSWRDEALASSEDQENTIDQMAEQLKTLDFQKM